MIFEFVKIGRPKDQFSELVRTYQNRLGRQVRFEVKIIKAHSGENKAFEKSLLAPRSPGDVLIAMDERGKLVKTQEIADGMRRWKNEGIVKKVTFVVGGPTGLSQQVRAAATSVWCLSGCVLPSDFAWLILWEQVYRAQSILSGSPYHNE